MTKRFYEEVLHTVLLLI